MVCNEHECIFNCMGTNVCSYAQFQCNNSSFSLRKVDCQGYQACHVIDVYSEANTIINGDGESSCKTTPSSNRDWDIYVKLTLLVLNVMSTMISLKHSLFCVLLMINILTQSMYYYMIPV